MAILHMAARAQHLAAEARVVHKTKEESAWQERSAKKRLWLLVVHILLILAVAALVLYVLLWPGVLGSVLTAVKETLNRWRDRLSDYILMPESAERPEHSAGMVWLGILLALDWVLRTVGRLLLLVLAWASPVLIVGGMIGAAFLIIRYSCTVIGDNWERKPKKAEIKDKVVRSLSKEMAKDYDESQSEQQALSSLMVLSDACHIFSGLEITCGGESFRTDLIVVSPSGVTVVDVRNDSGLLFGDLSEKKWYQWKHLDTNPFEKKKYSNEEIPNPVKELGALVDQLAFYLKEQGIPIPVQGCILFTNENIQLHNTDHKGISKSCPLFLINAPELPDYLHSAERLALRPAVIQQAVEALKRQMPVRQG